MKISLQKFLIIILLKSLFLTCLAKKLKLSNNSPNLKEKKNTTKENKDNVSLIEKKSESKNTPVNKFFKKRLDQPLIFMQLMNLQKKQTNLLMLKLIINMNQQ
jgi:hypothetical protein